MYAQAPDGERIEALPTARGICPACGGVLIPKCGEINVWHWAHKSLIDCDPWYESETDWHLSWKRLMQPERCEVVIGPHRADIVGNGNRVIELQHSPISVGEIRERETFYGDMVWLFDMREAFENKNIILWFPVEGVEFPYTFNNLHWKRPRKSILYCRKPVCLDFGVYIYQVTRWATKGRCAEGIISNRNQFIESMLSDYTKSERPTP